MVGAKLAEVKKSVVLETDVFVGSLSIDNFKGGNVTLKLCCTAVKPKFKEFNFQDERGEMSTQNLWWAEQHADRICNYCQNAEGKGIWVRDENFKSRRGRERGRTKEGRKWDEGPSGRSGEVEGNGDEWRQWRLSLSNP